MTQSRQHKILQAIVEDYISFREPVGSKALIERHHLGVSSATVRNDMSILEEQGLISAPHSSAGRIPTEKGYRFFVDELSNPRPLSTAQKRAIHRLLDSYDSVDEILAQTVKILSQLTQQVAILQYPSAPENVVRHIELIPVGEHHVTVMLISNSGQLTQRLAQVERYREEELELLRIRLIEKCQQQKYQVARSLLASLPSSRDVPHSLENGVLDALGQLLSPKDTSKLLIAGTSYLAQSTEDFSTSIAPILEALEEQVTMLHLLAEMAQDPRGYAVRIGTENSAAPLSETSIVTSVYSSPSCTAKLGVVGPTRMDYAGSTAAVRAVAKYLSKILGS
ncbi:heat-inducible transcriptional repressor HrcA [Rothia sp. P7208]|uniref:heat-inducible transcriptional repressor HrcA n=1 Tax=Rothia sp. P7208 TaxID=3402660 RepID=UPI003ACF4C1B